MTYLLISLRNKIEKRYKTKKKMLNINKNKNLICFLKKNFIFFE